MSQEQVEDAPACTEVYVLMRFDRTQLQAFRNTMVKCKSVLKTYGGQVITIAKDVHALDGKWNPSKTLGVLSFPNRDQAKRWFQSDNDVRQQDWLGTVDTIILPLQYPSPRNKETFVMIDANPLDEGAFLNDYVNAQIEPLRAAGASCYTVASKVHDNLRGLWLPSFAIMHQFNHLADANSYYKSEAYLKDVQPVRHATAKSTVVVFHHEHCKECETIM